MLEHYIFADMLGQLGRCRKNRQQTVVLIFVGRKYIIPDSVDELVGLDFVYLQSPVEMTNKLKIQEIVSKLYKHNLQTTCKKNLITYH